MTIKTPVHISCEKDNNNCERRSTPVMALVLGDGRLRLRPPLGWITFDDGRAFCPSHANQAPKTGRTNDTKDFQ